MNEPTPDLFVDAAFAYLKTAAIKAAVALDLFTAIAQEEGGLDRVAARTGASKRGVRILCDYLTVQGFLSKTDNGYALTPSTQTFLALGPDPVVHRRQHLHEVHAGPPRGLSQRQRIRRHFDELEPTAESCVQQRYRPVGGIH